MNDGHRPDRRPGVSSAFVALIAAQAVHSVEEYHFRLYDVLPPARFVSEALGFDRALGFVIANVLLVSFGLWCYFARVRPERGAWRHFAWFWAILEGANGITHVGLAAAAGGYFPGLITAPLLMITAALLVSRLQGTTRRSRSA